MIEHKTTKHKIDKNTQWLGTLLDETEKFTRAMSGVKETLEQEMLRTQPADWQVVNTMLDNECSSCCEEMPVNECPNSKRPCGHHCNHVWSHDSCCWCGKEFGEEA